MGLLVDGTWQDKWYDTKQSDGRFVRDEATFRHWVRADGSTPFAPEPGRYHLYISYACPWASRALIVRKLKRLEEAIGVTSVHPLMLSQGWEFDPENPEPCLGLERLHQLYATANPRFTGRVTVPVLWDKQRKTIVSNESSEIIRMFNHEMNAFANASVDLYPEPLRPAIDEINALVYNTVNNGVYRAGFATTQAAYQEAVTALFSTLDGLEQRLAAQRYLVGEVLTEADWRLFTTLIRFDAVYHGHFKCNLKRLADYPNLWGYTRELYQVPGVAETVRFDHIKGHYYRSHTTINPSGIVPAGPILALDAPHGRG